MPGPEESTTQGGVLKPDLQQRNRTAAALKFNLRRQTESAAPSCTSSRLTRRQSAELRSCRGEEGGEEEGGEEGGEEGVRGDSCHTQTGGCVPVEVLVSSVTSGHGRKLLK